MDPMIGGILALVPLAFGLSTALTWALRAFGRRRALLDSAGAAGHSKALRAVPNIGGIAIFLSVAAPLLLGVLAVNGGVVTWLLSDSALAEAVSVHVPGVRAQTPLALALLACLAVLHVIGVLDDRRALGVLPKLVVMLLAAMVMSAVFDVRLLTMLDPLVGGAWLSIAITVLWLVVVTNAMNFMDNHDGLAAGVGVISGALFLTATLLNGQWFVAATLALLVGSLAGFLVFNFPRKGGATIFMGDGGSLVLGFLLAFLTARTTYVPVGALSSQGPDSFASGAWYGLFMPLCVLAVPLYDLVTVSVIRIAEGRSPFVGDQRHFSHRLRARGLSPTQTVAVICGCAAITGIGGVLLSRLAPWQAALVGVQTILTLLVLALYEFASAAQPTTPSRGAS